MLKTDGFYQNTLKGKDDIVSNFWSLFESKTARQPVFTEPGGL
jgi:hypothetical protein